MARLANSPLSSMFANFDGNLEDDDEIRRNANSDSEMQDLLSFKAPKQKAAADGNIFDANAFEQDSPNDPETSPAQRRAECTASGGRWIPTGPYGEGNCVHDQESTPYESGCPAGEEKSPFDASGNDAPYPLECVTSAEAQRRFELRKTKNASKSSSTSSSSSSSSASATAAGVPGTDLWNDMFRDLYSKFGNVKLPYDAAAIAELEGKLKASAASEAAQNSRKLMASRATMGLGNTGKTSQGLRNITSEANQKYNTGMIDVNDMARKANYQAEINKLASQLSVLDSQAQLVIGLTNSATQRMQVQNAYAMERARLTQQMEELKLRLAWGDL